MRSVACCFLFHFVLTLWPAPALFAAAPRAYVASPNGDVRAEVWLDVDGRPHWRAWYHDLPVLQPSPLGLVVAGQNLASGLRWASADPVSDGEERYSLVTGPRRAVTTPWRQVSVGLIGPGHGRLIIELRAADAGVAMRYRVLPPVGYSGVPVRVDDDLTGFALPAGRAWLLPYHQPSDYTPAYEDFYQEVEIGQPPGPCRGPQPAAGWSFGGLYSLAEGRAWALTVESGVDETYCGTHLSDGTDGTYHVRWPLAGEYKKSVPLVRGSSAAPEARLPLTTPWRGLALGASAAAIATTTWPTDLAQPCALSDASWVRAGRASWSWLSTPDRFDRSVFEEFLDFAAEMGWEYSLLDAGWWNEPLDQMAAAAQAKGVGLFIWGDSTEHYDPPDQRRRLDEAASLGLAGFKIDFWCSDKQVAISTMLNLLREAAARRLCVVLHGCTLPRGWQRTWPNLLAAEAVLGEETYFFEPDFAQRAPEHHCLLPFTRNACAPMDYTPAPLGDSPWAHTATAAHQLALPIVQTSGLVCGGGRPEWYRALGPEAIELLRSAPAAWDESRCLAGEPGRLVVMARRDGETWYVAALNGQHQPRTLDLDLTSLDLDPAAEWLAVSDGADQRLAAQRQAGTPPTQLTLAAAGGWVLRATRRAAR